MLRGREAVVGGIPFSKNGRFGGVSGPCRVNRKGPPGSLKLPRSVGRERGMWKIPLLKGRSTALFPKEDTIPLGGERCSPW